MSDVLPGHLRACHSMHVDRQSTSDLVLMKLAVVSGMILCFLRCTPCVALYS